MRLIGAERPGKRRSNVWKGGAESRVFSLATLTFHYINLPIDEDPCEGGMDLKMTVINTVREACFFLFVCFFCIFNNYSKRARWI